MQIWSRASSLAAQTPPERNRYVDFLRAVSILFVVVGHWLIATAHYVDGEITGGHLLLAEPWTHWLTWLFQVMPIFFIVGGYSNAVSLESAKRKGIGYAGWLAARLNRLVAPLLVLLIAWAAIALLLYLLGLDKDTIQYVSRSSLIPIWFLAIYIMLVVLAPAAYAFWRRYGFVSFWVFVLLAALTDYVFFAFDLPWLGWANYFWVWLGVHHLGFAWRDGRLPGPAALLGIAAAAFVTLYLVIFNGPYPLAMVGRPGEEVSNTLPPKITLLVLGMVQLGVLLAIEAPMRKALANSVVWTTTVLINSMIMTIYLWHMTMMIGVVTVLYYAGGIGLTIEPGSNLWWASRPVWVGALLALLLPVALLLSPFERTARSAALSPPSGARQVAGAIMISLGVAIIAMYGFFGGPIPRIDVAAFVLVLAGAATGGLSPRRA